MRQFEYSVIPVRTFPDSVISNFGVSMTDEFMANELRHPLLTPVIKDSDSYISGVRGFLEISAVNKSTDEVTYTMSKIIVTVDDNSIDRFRKENIALREQVRNLQAAVEKLGSMINS